MAKPHEVPDLDPDHVSVDLGYQVSDLPEPHAARRREILTAHPEIRSLFGPDPRQAWITVAVVAGQLVLAGLLASARAQCWVVMGLAYLIGAVANHWGGVVIHEASHNLACRGGEVRNRLVAMLANLPILVPAANSFRRYHLDHHRYLGVEHLDNDLPMAFEIRWVGTSWWRKVVWYALFSFFAVFSRGFFRRPDRWEVAGVLVQGVVTAGLFATFGWTAVFYLGLSTLFGFGLHPIAAHWVHEHYVFEPGQETYSYYGPLNRLTFNMGYHVEHHDFPGVAGSRLPELNAIAREYYASLHHHDSWGGLLWRFFVDRGLGHHSRVVRRYRTWRDGRHRPDPAGSLARACDAGPPA
jgi:sphingolipid 4-desaturase/C4-monooxygenase